MSGEHTPGPWLCESGTVYALDESGNCNRFSVRVDGGWKWRGYGMFPAPADRTPVAELEANARLISAAPDFMRAAQRLLVVFDQQKMTIAERIVAGISDADLRNEGNAAVEALRSAIAKATGKP